jgi:hypothetical protein
MKDILKGITTTSFLGTLVVIFCFAYFFLSGSGLFKAPESLQTQITQGLFGLIGLVVGYYFGSSKKDHSPIKEEPKP